MKKTIQLLFVIALLSFTACENEPLEGFDLLSPAAAAAAAAAETGMGTNTNGTGTNSNLPSSTGTSEGDYFPRAINNEWNYSQTFGGQTVNQDVKLINSFVDSGQTVFETESSTLTSGSTTVVTKNFIYKSGGDYYVYSSENDLDLGAYQGTQTAIPAYVFLKDNQPVGHTWTVNYSQTTSYTTTTPGLPNLPDVVTNITNDFEIVEKDMTITVGTETYSPVIKLKSVLTSSSVAGSTSTEIFQFFAKDVGFIKSETSGSAVSLTVLNNYTLF